MPATALHVSPHPDDECLGAGPTLLALRAHGWRVVNLACSFGTEAAAAARRRAAELVFGWRAAAPRRLDPADPLAPARAGHDAGPLLHEPSPRARADHPGPDA